VSSRYTFAQAFSGKQEAFVMQEVGQAAVPQAGGVFQIVLPVRWGDLDALNHVNNTVYMRYVDEARAQLYALAGIPVPGDRASLLVHMESDFLKPMTYPATAVISLVFKRLGRSSMAFDFIIDTQAAPGEVYVRGENVIVCTDVHTGQAVPWSEDELRRFASCFALTETASQE